MNLQSHPDSLAGQVQALDLQEPKLQKERLALGKYINTLPVNSDEFAKVGKELQDLDVKIRKAKVQDDLLLHQVYVNLGVYTL